MQEIRVWQRSPGQAVCSASRMWRGVLFLSGVLPSPVPSSPSGVLPSPVHLSPSGVLPSCPLKPLWGTPLSCPLEPLWGAPLSCPLEPGLGCGPGDSVAGSPGSPGSRTLAGAEKSRDVWGLRLRALLVGPVLGLRSLPAQCLPSRVPAWSSHRALPTPL